MRNYPALTIFFFAVSAAAQLAPLERGPAERPPLPEFRKEAPPRFVLPPAPLFPTPRLPGVIKITVSRFLVTGASAFAPAELEKILAPYTGRPVGSEELEEARVAVTRHYVNAGYINSGAVIPDQDVRGGVVEIRVIEGRLTGVAVGGEHGFVPGFIERRVALGAGPPLNVLHLQERMQILLQNPQIERINAELAPGLRPGEAALRMELAEAPRRTVAFAVANNRSPAVGGSRGEAQIGLRNTLGHGDAFGLRIGMAKGLEDATATFSVPVSARDTLLSLKLERTEAQVVEPPFDIIDITNKTEYWEAGLTHPVHRTVSRELALGATLSNRRNASFLLGQPFSFSPGIADGRSTVSALRLAGDFTDRGTDHVLAARLTVSYGLNAMGSTILPDGLPDSRFVTRLAQAQWARRLGAELGQLILRADWQRANGALLASEKFALGGAQSVRGYRENALVRDNGWVMSAEYRHPLGRFAWPGQSGDSAGPLEAALFADRGSGHDDLGPTRHLSSIGFGFRWTPFPGGLLQLYKGYALNQPENNTRNLQDRGIHFLVGLQASF